AGVLHPPRDGRRPDRELVPRRARAARGLEEPETRAVGSTEARTGVASAEPARSAGAGFAGAGSGVRSGGSGFAGAGAGTGGWGGTPRHPPRDTLGTCDRVSSF